MNGRKITSLSASIAIGTPFFGWSIRSLNEDFSYQKLISNGKLNSALEEIENRMPR